jgi:3-mercaptopyruvate sulfurtransferase SseA/sterol desaturase/sphingolipid hydroxylase (fatty acid hydroxylase superfamily)
MWPWLYPAALAAISLAVAVAERLRPWRPEQRAWRRTLPSDFAHLVFNGHFLGMILYGIATWHLLPVVDAWLERAGWHGAVYRNFASDWPLWVQIPVVLIVIDFVQWCVHVMLHRVPWLWRFHQTHHSIVDGEMDWIVSFRFQWAEVVVYKAVQYLPLAFFGFAPEAAMTHAILGTLVGHLNHANLDLGRGWWRYVINSPRMHIWHHDYEADGRTTVNFGIIFSAWDWIFGTAKMPAHPPARLGFAGVERFPRSFLAQAAWPVSGRVAPVAGAALIGFGYWLSLPPSAPEASFGGEAATAGFAHPEDHASVAELHAALGAPDLVVLDVRPAKRFHDGHVPGAQPVARSDYEAPGDVAGLSADAARLQAMLRARGVDEGDTLVLYGDGGPEPYRLWWTLRVMAGVESRVLDGGLVAWKAAGHPVEGGPAAPVAAGGLVVPGPSKAPRPLWADLAPDAPGTLLLDVRSPEEYRGDIVHPQAARAGHVPGAVNLPWEGVLGDDGHLRAPSDLRRLFAAAGVPTPGMCLAGGECDHDHRVVAMCQSGTRSAAVVFALRQLDAGALNYDGSWAEYSRLPAPVACAGGGLC